jgi:hypothetical protein
MNTPQWDLRVNRTGDLAMSLLLAALSLTACGCQPELSDDDDLGVVNPAVRVENSLTWNSLTSNSLVPNSLTSNSLTSNSLAKTALTDDPLARELLKYIVGCALPADATITITLGGTPYSFAGQLGLAPEWGKAGGTCSMSCRSWVSACVLSRVNYLGESVEISLRGSHALSASAVEEAAYPNREAAYFGDIFASPQVRYACTSPGSSLISRVCGPSTSGCVMDVLGDCTEFCTKPRSDGGYPNCGPDKDTKFIGSVTVFRE